MLLREAISIPEHVSASDFVLKLDVGVEQASTTVAEYVVTDSIDITVTDAAGLTATRSVTFTITGADDTPPNRHGPQDAQNH